MEYVFFYAISVVVSYLMFRNILIEEPFFDAGIFTVVLFIPVANIIVAILIYFMEIIAPSINRAINFRKLLFRIDDDKEV